MWMLPAVVAAIGVASPAQAQQQPTAPATTTAAATPATAEVLAEARRAYGEGTEHFNAGRFAEALASFERAFALRANPVVLKPIAECHERLGHVPEAIAALERYLRELPTAADHAQLEARLATLRQRPARVSVSSTPDGAQIVVDGESRPQRTPADVDVPPGHHRISANLSGYRATEREVETSPGVPLSVGVTLEREGASGVTPVPPDGVTPPPPVTGRRVSSAVWVATAVAGAAAVAGTVFGIMALSDANDYETAPTQDLLDRGQRNALLSDVSFAASVLSAGVAVVVYFADRGRTESAATPAATSSARLQFTGTGVRVTF